MTTRQGGGALLPCMVATRLDTRCCLGHFPEQVADNDVASLGSIFGLVLVEFGPWALKQSCSFPDALQLIFRVLGH